MRVLIGVCVTILIGWIGFMSWPERGLSGPGEGGCTARLERSESSPTLAMANGCSAGAGFWSSLAEQRGVHAAFEGRDRLYFGQTPIEGWPWATCDVFAALSQAPEWAESISNPEAVAVLEATLDNLPLSTEAASVFRTAGVSIKSLDIDVVFLDVAGDFSDCPSAPTRVPLRADLDITLSR